ILPLFALASAGVRLDGQILAAAWRSPLTWGVVAGLVVGKFVGIAGATAAVRALRLGDLGPGLTMEKVTGGAALCGIGFTLSLFIVELAISDPASANEARVGVLVASALAFTLAALVFRVTGRARPAAGGGAPAGPPVARAQQPGVFVELPRPAGPPGHAPPALAEKGPLRPPLPHVLAWI
ncbi:MAG TPA: Na+/H+ antiporter NhaA, partial [Actinotalea sp.]|nr:Na+/H+ antiporter NhaA [Actinotalea sp.]